VVARLIAFLDGVRQSSKEPQMGSADQSQPIKALQKERRALEREQRARDEARSEPFSRESGI